MLCMYLKLAIRRKGGKHGTFSGRVIDVTTAGNGSGSGRKTRRAAADIAMTMGPNNCTCPTPITLYYLGFIILCYDFAVRTVSNNTSSNR